MKNEIPVAGVAHQAGTCRFGTDPATSVLERRLPGARARQPLRRRHERLPEHRRGQPGADRDGELAARRRPPARAHRLRLSAELGAAPSGEQIEIAPATSGRLSSRSAAGCARTRPAGRELLDGYARRGDGRSGRGQVLIPWPNRLEDGSYEFDGRRHQLPLDEPARENAIHGLVRWAAWTVAERDGDRVVVEHMLHPQPGYPFALALAIEYALVGRGLAVRTTATNVGDEPCPYGSRRASVPDRRHGDGRPGAPARPGANRAAAPTSAGIPTGSQPVDGTELRLPRSRGGSGRRGSTTRSPISSATRTASRGSSSGAPARRGAHALGRRELPLLMLFTGDRCPTSTAAASPSSR